MTHRGALLALAFALVLWSITFPLVRSMIADVPLEVLITVRFSLAAVLLGLVWLFRRHPLPRGRDLGLAALSGFCCVTLYQLLSTHGIRTVSSGPATVLVDTMPIFATLLSVFVLRQRPQWKTWLGMGVSVAGVIVIALGESGGRFHLNLGAVLLLGAALIFSLGTIAQKPLMQRYDALAVTTVSFAAGAVAMLPFTPDLTASALRIPERHMANILFLAAGPGALAYALWAFALQKLPVSKASASLFLIAPMTFAIAWVFFGEIPALTSLIGAAITLGGVMLVHADQSA